jgi:hypothetical protein
MKEEYHLKVDSLNKELLRVEDEKAKEMKR